MLKEARKPKYQTSGFFLRYFKRFPSGVDPENLLPVQRDFIVYLTAITPPLEAISTSIQYEEEKKEILNKNYANEIKIHKDVLGAIAKTKGQDHNEYITDHIKKESDKLRQKALRELNEGYGIKVNNKVSGKDEILEHYAEMSKQLEKNNLRTRIMQKPEALQNGAKV